ncbi:gamma-glutamylcyclotransferase family protein [uncultured Methylophaga sp.]|uniref:gamma-glutamylcyclotransferase family protein n=1 Tax=uncultured Methylophaga sp. TaxID=285271 RepID=UPI00261C6078|nr:gamma-glutamylcyclotransferase family protein [uncultured Methylophaga sp.]
MTEDYLFVYGTLRKNTERHDLLQRFCDYIDTGMLQAVMYQISYYPGVILTDDPQQQVVGEVYRIHQPQLLLAELDDYEECSSSFVEPHEYVRQLQMICLSNGNKLPAWVYLYNHPISGKKLITSGDFLNP